MGETIFSLPLQSTWGLYAHESTKESKFYSVVTYCFRIEPNGGIAYTSSMGKIFRMNGYHSKTWSCSITCNRKSSVLETNSQQEQQNYLWRPWNQSNYRIFFFPCKKCNCPVNFYICLSDVMAIIATPLWTKTSQATQRETSLLLPAVQPITPRLLISWHKQNATA